MKILLIFTYKIKARGGDWVVEGKGVTENFRERREERKKEIWRGRREEDRR